MGCIDLEFQGHLGHFDAVLYENWLDWIITCNGFQLQWPNVNQICNLINSQLVMNMGIIEIDLQCLLDISTQNSMKWHSMYIALFPTNYMSIINFTYILQIVNIIWWWLPEKTMSLLYTDPGWPRGGTRANVLLLMYCIWDIKRNWFHKNPIL